MLVSMLQWYAMSGCLALLKQQCYRNQNHLLNLQNSIEKSERKIKASPNLLPNHSTICLDGKFLQMSKQYCHNLRLQFLPQGIFMLCLKTPATPYRFSKDLVKMRVAFLTVEPLQKPDIDESPQAFGGWIHRYKFHIKIFCCVAVIQHIQAIHKMTLKHL